jgi:hypothetical protein
MQSSVNGYGIYSDVILYSAKEKYRDKFAWFFFEDPLAYISGLQIK